MGDKTNIEWTDSTWNPITGCDRVSEGCRNCYALRFAERWRGIPGHPYEDGFDLVLRRERLEQPLRWQRPRHIFVNSMSDLFHEGIEVSYIQEVFAVMAQATQHRFQILTKRHHRLVKLADQLPWPTNVWMGVSVETQRWVERVDALRCTPAHIKFLSCEPLLEGLYLDLNGIDWVIVGGESGPGARPMQAQWALSLRDQCQASDTAFFFKQWGEYDAMGIRRGKKAAGRVLDYHTYDEMPPTA